MFLVFTFPNVTMFHRINTPKLGENIWTKPDLTNSGIRTNINLIIIP